ncbi:uncharacterized protein N7446_003195 [Penicillium canescens]|uniref:Uncharacterized protein n=1 Tax=Penicillium canescens TaxID=5083 RepID=A0AAD6NAH4_PENCN|nr:uncharacterized protein N7446_003195 [Penicillium canescens]KAJ6044994.1 hypothetical protein N7460_006349 [Penicillium canescens]KAJ6056464.1 hypothetical protein N7444_005562 [Penicillium canescens]KAJ6075418.1 hypothetical protein N7446_003195 [Penicillium canescens]
MTNDKVVILRYARDGAEFLIFALASSRPVVYDATCLFQDMGVSLDFMLMFCVSFGWLGVSFDTQPSDCG